MLLLGVSTRRLTDGEAIVDVPPMVGRNVDRLDAAHLDRVDKLEHALDLGPAIGAQQDVAAGAHTRQGLAALACADGADDVEARSEEHTSELQSLMRISYAVFCLKKKKKTTHKSNKNKI